MMNKEVKSNKVITNADRLRTMTDEELAAVMTVHNIDSICDIVCNSECYAVDTLDKTSEEVCKDIILKWLRKKAIDKNYNKEKINYDRLRQLVEADWDERCMVLPCNIGDKVYHIACCKNFWGVLDGTLYGVNGEHGTATGSYCPCELNDNCPFPLEEDGSFDCEKHKNNKAIYEDTVIEIVINATENFVKLDYSGWVDFNEFGRTVFFTREAAENALKGEINNGNFNTSKSN